MNSTLSDGQNTSMKLEDGRVITEKKLEDVIGALWKLKKIFDRHKAQTIKPINFNKLLRDEDYRVKILSSLLEIKKHGIGKLAKDLYKLDLRGSVHIDDVRARKHSSAQAVPVNGGQASDSVALESQPLYQTVVKKMQLWKSISIVSLVGLFCSVCLHLYPLFNFGSNQVLVAAPITENTLWNAETEYILTKPIFVEGDAVLSIEAGTRIRGQAGSALIVTRAAQILARGTEALPIVFTSANDIGTRQRGDWGGLVLLGDAPINREQGFVEGVDKKDVRGHFGGAVSTNNCGTLEYVRVEFAGFEAFVDNELNGLTLGGCGSETVVRNVQVHKSLDDGIEVFGGTVNLKNIVITGAGDDAFDWDMGWRGRVQFMVVQMHGDAGDNAFEGDNAKAQMNAEPRSNPSFYNVTLLGGNTQQVSQRAMTIRLGSAGSFNNILIQGFSNEAIDLKDHVAELVAEGSLQFKSLLLNEINKGVYFSSELDENDDDFGFSERDYFSDPQVNARFGINLRLPAEAHNIYTPKFIPLSHSPARDHAAPIPQGEFWDESANFLGAIRPGAATDWSENWTSFPSS